LRPHSITRRRLFSALVCAAFAALPRGARCQAADARWHYDISTLDNRHTNGWLPGFSDFSLATASINRRAEVRQMPPETETNERFAYYLRGRNTSDDLFMFLKKPVIGLANNRSYDVSFQIEFASAAPSNCAGIGGAPGESVWLKAGATSLEPVAALQDDNMIRLTADKGKQSNGGADAVVVSDIADGIPCEQATGRFVLLRRSTQLPTPVQSDGQGSLWVFLGTDSGFEGTTEIYYAFIAVLLTLRD
jgi:hypothetical protein